MINKFIIVESPNKIKKIKSFLSNDYGVSASCGHIRNMDPKCMSIDIEASENKFEPIYIVVSDKKKIVSSLKSELKNIGSTGIVYLAMDYDREGEAIAWHLNEVLKLKPSQTKRILFTEITKKAILNAVEKPTQIDMNMFYSQQARMVLDKLIGYMLSPILWKNFNNWKLSAGRVQSVVVKIIQEREAEIAKFKSSKFYKIGCDFWINEKDREKNNTRMSIKNAILKSTLENEIKTKEQLDILVKYIPHSDTKFIVNSKKTSQSKRKPPPPFITSSLQQEASNKLSMSPKSTMSSAQKLYECGLITYMRTDSMVLSEDAHKGIYKKVVTKFGENYYKKIQYKSKSKNSQEAHESIRPTHFEKESVLEENNKINSYDNRLYQLIWKRTVASQMKPAEVETTTIKVILENNLCDNKNSILDYCFVAKAEKILFDGYLKLYGIKTTSEENQEDNDTDSKSSNMNENTIKKIKAIKKGDEVYFALFDALEKNSKSPKSRFTEASLIKRLDELEIGRPSTYASMTTKVQTKLYVEKKTIAPVKKDFIHLTLEYPDKKTETTKKMSVDGEKNKLFVTPLGFMINEYLNKEFANILDYSFTANVEKLLDDIAKGNKVWNIVVGEVYNTFNPTVEKLNISFKKAKALGGGGGKSSNQGNIIELGEHPDSKIPIIVMNTRYGPAVVLNHTDKVLRKYANFTGALDSITLEKAIYMLQYPKIIGLYENSNVIINKRANYYITHKKKNYSIDIYNKNNSEKDDFTIITGETITLEDAIKVIKSIGNNGGDDIKINKDIIIKKGPYGFYIKYKGKNNVSIPYKLKKKYDTFEKIKSITLEECEECIEKFKSKKGKGNSSSTSVKGKKKK